jgi:hypothetical protein
MKPEAGHKIKDKTKRLKMLIAVVVVGGQAYIGEGRLGERWVSVGVTH